MYAGKIVTISIGGEYTERLYCSHEFADGKVVLCHGLGKSGVMPIAVESIVSVGESVDFPLKSIPNGAKIFAKNGDTVRVVTGEYDCSVTLESNSYSFHLGYFCNIHQLIRILGYGQDNTIYFSHADYKPYDKITLKKGDNYLFDVSEIALVSI